MARGFESKDVEYQQAEAERVKQLGRALTPDERDVQVKRGTLTLALTRARADLAAATTPAHKKMLTAAIAALEQQLATIATMLVVVCIALSATACGQREGDAAPASTSPPAGAVAPATATSTAPRVVVLGDSLTAGLGLPARDAYPTLLQQRLKAEGSPFEVVNAGVSGDTSADGLSRLDWALEGDVRVLVVALGGNDGLRGLPVEQLRDNLAAIIERAQAKDIRVILAGMEAPPNYGRDYIVSFHKVYPALAARYHVALIPFLLQNVAGIESLNQHDGIHPTAAGARIVADTVWTALKPAVEEASRHEGRSGS